MRNKRVIVYLLAVFATLLLLAYGALFWPLPVERTLKTEASPDGTRTATYSWRPCGVVGAFTEDNPWVYLTIREQATGRVVARYSFWADAPNEAEQRLASQKTW
jgi:hypothetical protein